MQESKRKSNNSPDIQPTNIAGRKTTEASLDFQQNFHIWNRSWTINIYSSPLIRLPLPKSGSASTA